MTGTFSIRRLFGIAILMAACVTIFGVVLNHYHKKELLRINALPFQGAGGWGYEIKVGGKTFIHQDHIPAVTGLHGFASKQDALKIAALVSSKIKQGLVPSVSVKELQQEGIDTNFPGQ
jgi:hypothetical protein